MSRLLAGRPAICFLFLFLLASCEHDVFDRIQITTDRSFYAVGDTGQIRIANNTDDSLKVGACHGELAYVIEQQIGMVWMEAGMVHMICDDSGKPWVDIGPGRTFQQDFLIDGSFFSAGGYHRLNFDCELGSQRDDRFSNNFRVR